MGQGPRSGTRNPLSQLDPPPAGATSLLTAYANVNISGGPGVGPSQDCVDTRTGSTAAPATANIACQDMQQNHFILSDGSSAEIDYLAGGGAEAIATFGKLGVGGALQHDRGGDPTFRLLWRLRIRSLKGCCLYARYDRTAVHAGHSRLLVLLDRYRRGGNPGRTGCSSVRWVIKRESSSSTGTAMLLRALPTGKRVPRLITNCRYSDCRHRSCFNYKDLLTANRSPPRSPVVTLRPTTCTRPASWRSTWLTPQAV